MTHILSNQKLVLQCWLYYNQSRLRHHRCALNRRRVMMSFVMCATVAFRIRKCIGLVMFRRIVRGFFIESRFGSQNPCAVSSRDGVEVYSLACQPVLVWNCVCRLLFIERVAFLSTNVLPRILDHFGLPCLEARRSNRKWNQQPSNTQKNKTRK
ncbi:hypothetical protein BC830DRAFT_525342 [Chytriomyces sp. MP71]|nr:hypothetical protein BC830DRAFT_525342 [Chytriomyces sp. MP71]